MLEVSMSIEIVFRPLLAILTTCGSQYITFLDSS